MKQVVTRFRAYQLGTPGSSFSYCAGNHFTLLEGRLTDLSRLTLVQEMGLCGVDSADTLHITSWDVDHCAPNELGELLQLVRPRRLELPGYDPTTDSGRESMRILDAYRTRSNRQVVMQSVTPEYVRSLQSAHDLAYQDVIYNPTAIDWSCANDNSTVKLYRCGSFNVLSLGDVESTNIGAYLRRCRLLRREVDIMILAHHGADNGFTTKKFLEHLEPKLAICSSDYDNMYEHPCDSIKELLYEQGIRLMTTKTGDVVVASAAPHQGAYNAFNLKANSTELSSALPFTAKKAPLLMHNADTIRQTFGPRSNHPR